MTQPGGPAPPPAASAGAPTPPTTTGESSPRASPPAPVKGKRGGAPKTPVRAAAPPGATGTLDVACLPWCEIRIDGRDTNKTSPLRGYELSAGSHTVEVVNPPSGARAAKQIEVRAGETVSVPFRLE